jgi:hypothetical protein
MKRHSLLLHLVLFAGFVVSAFWNVFRYAANSSHYLNALFAVSTIVVCSGIVFGTFLACLWAQYRRSSVEARFVQHEVILLLSIFPYWLFRLALVNVIPVISSALFFIVFFGLMNIAAPIILFLLARRSRTR